MKNNQPRTGRAGRILQKKRWELGIKQKDVAAEIGISPSFLSGVENGARQITADGYLEIMSMYKRLEKETTER